MPVNLKDAILGRNQYSTMDLLTREQKFYYRYQMYNDNYKDLVLKRMLEIYPKAYDVLLTAQIDLTNNIFKKIINRISRVYAFGCERTIEDANAQTVYKQLNVDSFMIEADKKLNAFNDLLIHIAWDYKNNKPALMFRYPHATKVEVDSFGNVEEVEYLVSKEKDQEKWAYWTKDEHYYKVYDKKNKVKIEYVEGNENGINPYGILPFVFMNNQFRDSGQFYDEFGGEDLINITLDNSIYSTFKNYLIKWQSFKQIVVTGSNVGAISGQMLDPSQALTASGQDIDIKLLDLQSNLQQLNDVLKDSVNQVALNYDISPQSFMMTQQVQSGFALQMQNLALDERTKLRQKDFVEYENELNKLIVLICNVNGMRLKENDFAVIINEPTYPLSDMEKIELWTKEIDLAIKSPVEILAESNGITDEEAIIKLNNNIAKRNELYNKVQVQALNDTTTLNALMGANPQ
ncbi:MAG: phage portal protein [Sediminibacterium sp.]